MKTKKIILYPLLVLSLVGCSFGTNSSSCNDMFCDESTSSSETNKLVLEDDTRSGYTFDSTVTNENASVNYEVFVRSFYDSNYDGIGDLRGLKSKLGYLSSLGVKNLWLMPINESPSYHGYDIKDYYKVNSNYGSNEDLVNLINEAKNYKMGIILDMVFNHTSNQCPWFIQAKQDYDSNNTSENSYANWYNFKSSGSYECYGGFSSMPDLNLDSPKVREEIQKICKFYIDMGVAGFRLDATSHYYPSSTNSISFLRWLNNYCKSLNEDFYIVGECWENQSKIDDFYNSSIDSFFSFSHSITGSASTSLVSLVKGGLNPDSFASAIENEEKKIKQINPKAVNSYFLSNHDQDRISKNFSGYFYKLGASITYLLPGTPYIYYGEEIGMKGERKTSPDDASDARRRLPMIWDKTDITGKCDFPEPTRQDLASSENSNNNLEGVNDLLKDGYSLLNHYKKVLNIRNKYPFIKDAVFTNLTGNVKNQSNKILMYKLSKDNEAIIVVHNVGNVDLKINIGDISTSILDEINTKKKIPSLDASHNLSIGGYSTVILNVK